MMHTTFATDRRTAMLAMFHRISLVLGIALLLGALVQCTQLVIPKIAAISQLAQDKTNAPHVVYVSEMLALQALPFMQLLIGAALFLGLARRRVQPFSRGTMAALVVLALLSFAQVGAKVAIAIAFVEQDPFMPFPDPARGIQSLALETLDVPSIILGVVLILAAVLVGYGKELYLDSESIA